MSITHIVLFQFKSGTDSKVIMDVRLNCTCLDIILKLTIWLKTCDRMLALKESCIHPTTNAPYIKTSSGGTDNSIEGLQVSKWMKLELGLDGAKILRMASLMHLSLCFPAPRTETIMWGRIRRIEPLCKVLTGLSRRHKSSTLRAGCLKKASSSRMGRWEKRFKWGIVNSA